MSQELGIIIQARSSSTRLPNKLLKEVEPGVCVFDLLINALNELKSDIPVVVATTNNDADFTIVDYCESRGVKWFRGDENDVLKRYIDCAEKYNFKSVVRICSDNPFLDINALDNLINKYSNEDYLSYQINGGPALLTHFGFFSEIVSINALRELQLKSDRDCFEHVTYCVYTKYKDEYNVKFIPIEIQKENIRCTLDTQQDFDNLQFIYLNLIKPSKRIIFDYNEIIAFISSNSELEEKMKIQKIQNSK